MKKFLKTFLCGLLATAMVVTSYPEIALAAGIDEIVEETVVAEDATDAVANDAAVVEEEVTAETADSVDPDAGVLPQSVFAPITAKGGGGGADDGNIDGTYGTALSAGANGNATYEASAATGTITGITYALKKPAGSYTANQIDTAIGNGTINKGTMLTDVTVASDGSIEDLGLKISQSDMTITISGTPKKIVKASENVTWYLVVSDATQNSTVNEPADDVYNRINVVIAGAASAVDATPDRLSNWNGTDGTLPNAANSAIVFGRGTSANTTSDYAIQGYSVLDKGDTTSTIDNVVPVELSVTSTLGEDESDYVNAEIIPFDKADASTNTAALVKSGPASVAAFTVTPSKSVDKVSTGVGAKFKVAPATGLTATAANGTVYKAVLKLTSGAFADIEIPLYFKVTSDLSIDKVIAHGGDEIAAATADGGSQPLFDLGTFKVGETIDDVSITVKGGTGDISFSADTSSSLAAGVLNGTGTPVTLKALPADLVADTATAKTYKIKGLVTPAANKIGTYYYALTATDAGTGVSTAKAYFKYTVAQADVKIEAIKGANDTGRTELKGNTPSFTWKGANTSTDLSKEFATLYITNNSESTLRFTGTLGKTTDFALDNSTFTTSGVEVAAGKNLAITITPKNASSTDTLTISAPGLATRALTLTYGQVAGLTITKPSANAAADGVDATDGNVGTAEVGEEFSYTLEAMYPSTVTGITWSVTGLSYDTTTLTTPVTNPTTNINTLKNTYGLELVDGTDNTITLKGTLKAAATADLGDDFTNTRDRGVGLIIEFTASPTNGVGAAATRTIAIQTIIPAKAISFTANGKTIKNDGTGVLSLGKVSIDKVDEAKATVTLTNDTKVKQEGVIANVTAVTATTTDSVTDSNVNRFKVVYDEDDAVKNTVIYGTNGSDGTGLTLDKGASGTFVIAADKTNLVRAGTYAVTVTVASKTSAFTAQTFTVNLTVDDVPKVVAPTSPGYTVGTEYNAGGSTAAALAYQATYAAGGTDSNEQNEFYYNLVSVYNEAGTQIETIPGLTWAKDAQGNGLGYFKGTPSLAGKYKVTVSATTNKLANEKTGYLTHDVTVAGNSNLSMKLESSDAIASGATYLLAGEVAGYAANSKKLTIVVNAAGEDATGVTVSVDNADDDRAAAEDLDGNGIADRVESSANPYETVNSKEYINVSTIASSITKGADNGTRLYVTTKAGAPAGFYKVKVTIKADNASPITVNLAMLVAEKLEISVPATYTAPIGKDLTASNLVFSATGGHDIQQIVWSEEPVNVDGSPKYYITKAGASDVDANADGDPDNNLVSAETGLWTLTEGDIIGAADGIGLKTNVFGTPNKAGTYTVKVKADAAGKNYTNITGGGASEIKSIIQRVADGNYVTASKTNAVIPAQTNLRATCALTITKSTDPQVTDLTYKTVDASSGKIAGTIVGDSLGNGYSKISSYTYPGVAEGYTNTAEAITVTMTGGDASNILKAKASLKDGRYFTITAGPTTETAIGNTVGITWTIQPIANLFAATNPYTDVLEIRGDNIADVDLTINFVVEAKSYKATIDNGIAPDADDTTDRVAYATGQTEGDANGDGTTKNSVELNPVTIGVTYVDVNNNGAYNAGTDIPDVADPITIAIRNTGNAALNNLKVAEVKKNAAGKYVGGGALLTLANGALDSNADGVANASDAKSGVFNPTVAGNNMVAGGFATFTVTNAIKTKSADTAYLEVSYTEGTATTSTEHLIYIPVDVTVYNPAVGTVTVAPGNTNGDTVAMTSLPESYDPAAAELKFTLSNSGTARSEKLVNVTVAYDGTGASAFQPAVVIPAAPDNNVDPSGNLVVAIRPVADLGVGTYTARVTFHATNIAADITRNITFEVTESTAFTANKVTTTGVDILNSTTATKLYNSVWFGLTASSQFVKSSDTSGIGSNNDTNKDHKIVLNLDKDSNNTGDVELTFTGTSNGTILKAVDKVKVKLLSTNSVTTANKAIELEDTQITAIGTNGLVTSGTTKGYYSSLTFNLFATVTYNAALFAEKTEDLQAFNEDITTGVPNADGQATGTITAIVPMGATLGSVFKDSKLPTGIITNEVFKNWYDDDDANDAAVSAATKVSKDMPNITAKTATITYSKGSDKTEDAGVKWTWTNTNGNINAVLELTDINGNNVEESKITIDKDSAAKYADQSEYLAEANLPFVLGPVEFDPLGTTPATCTKGSGKKVKATAYIKATAPGTSFDATNDTTWGAEGTDYYKYTSVYALDEADDATGHTWNNPVVTWTDANADGKYTKDEVAVSRTCSVCGDKIDLTVVSVTETISVEPTCTKDGKATYSVTYTDVDKFGKAAGSVTDTKNVKESDVKALGHKYALNVEWAADHKTATKATLVCGQCAETETGHSVDVTSSITYDLKIDPTSGEIISNQAIYAADTKDEVKSEIWMSHTEHTWSFDGFAWAPDLKSATGTFTCTVGNEKKPATVTMSDMTNGKELEKQVTEYTATVSADPDGKTIKAITETKYVWTATGAEATKADFNKAAGSSESGSGIGEPEQTGAAAVNLFYTDAELSIPLPTEADVTKGTGAWTSFFKVESDGTVTVIPTATADRKKAASAKNSLIVIPTVDSEGNVIGEFEYSLPVFYQKPALKLTSAKGNVKTGAGDQVLVTKVLEKKSTGEYEPLDVSDQDTDKVALFAAKTGTVAAEAGDNPGEVKLTASAKASGKVVVQLPNWSDKVELNYTVGASAKGVVTASVKSLTFNTGADKDAAQAQTFNVFLNGNEIASEDDGVTVELPKKDPGLTITGISEGKVTGSEIGFEYGSAAPTKGNYTYKFKSSDGGVATVKIVVSDAALTNKALTYKIPGNGKMNIINRTPMVLVPQFKGVSGEITDVTTDNTSFEVEYNEESGQVIVAPADWSKISATNQSVILKTTVSGVECTTEVKFKPLAKKPTVKIDKLVLPKNKVAASTDDDAAIGFAYINSVVKTGGKSFSVAPDKVEFLDGKNVLAKDDTNWTPVTKSGVTCFYDTEAGFIVVKALPGTNGKLKAVKVQLTYGTTTVTKSLAIKAK